MPQTNKQHEPIRIFEGEAQPYQPFWRLRNQAGTGGDPEIELYGPISEFSWFEDEITPKMFKDDLYKIGNGGPVTLRINSPGGDVTAASVMRAIMSEYPGDITVRIDGMAASAAVIVAMAGKTVRIQDTAYMMIHDPAVAVIMAVLDIETLGRWHDELVSIKKGIVDTYVAHTGMSTARIDRMMADETWMSAQEAVNYGFADEVIQGGQKPASNRAFVNALKNYVHVPPTLLSAAQDPAPASEPSQADIDREREAQRLRFEIALHI